MTSVTIKYRNSTDVTWTKIQIHQYIGEYVVTNLRENTMYNFKIQASNAIGPSKFSKVVRKRTASSLGKFKHGFLTYFGFKNKNEYHKVYFVSKKNLPTSCFATLLCK